MTNLTKQKEVFTTLENIFGKEVFHVGKQTGKSGKDHERIIKFKLTEMDSLSLLIPPGYPTDSIPTIIRSGKGSKNLTTEIYNEIELKLKEIFEVHSDAGLYELFQWFVFLFF